ncbi:MAG: type VI secretion system baseplate subunit TssG, partial [Silvanigrellaceae bacterium]|nr:type VI secretion system baseplate subunit TssG [Silvanigrellaceae bacterium]
FERFYLIDTYNKQDSFESVPSFKLKSNYSLAFSGSSIESIQESRRFKNTIEILVNFFPLTGAQGVYPDYLSEMLTDKSFLNDYSLEDFLDIFNHRLLLIFYQMLKAVKPYLSLSNPGSDQVSGWFYGLMGLNSPVQEEFVGLNPRPLLFYTGLLSQRKKSLSALSVLLNDYFCMKVEVFDFIGDFYPLLQSETTYLGKHLTNETRLGQGAVLGNSVWLQGNKMRLKLFLKEQHEPQDFYPGGKFFLALVSLVKFATEAFYNFEIQIIQKHIHRTKLSMKTKLGYNTWLVKNSCSNLNNVPIKFQYQL